ncbi:hypothetical protein HYPDE_33023 [Hyphomicrobium denitrificans 1NES1]|uniref:Uncharacterized protein n=1 Tax=Hyphomicrobium denitrificans 1NES1 TaxID=670307 RepID=N0B7M9_9HYPH|nr:hypothetical protein HYPDE_33023 [Hyphomicrobium denitrificans 1NES1]
MAVGVIDRDGHSVNSQIVRGTIAKLGETASGPQRSGLAAQTGCFPRLYYAGQITLWGTELPNRGVECRLPASYYGLKHAGD